MVARFVSTHKRGGGCVVTQAATRFIFGVILLLLALGSVRPVGAVSAITWSSLPNKTNLTSSDALMDSGFTFELGVFDAGYTPDPARKWEWRSKWHIAQTTPYVDATKSFFGSLPMTLRPVPNQAPFAIGAKAYIWGRKPMPDGSEEWILFRHSNWLWPKENDDTNTDTIYWRPSEASVVLVGTIHTDGNPFLMQSAAVRTLTWTQFQATALAGEPLNGPNDDPDGDGSSNLMEFVHITDPLNRMEAYFPVVDFANDGGQSFLSMAVERSIDRAVLLTIQFSSDLQIWQDGPALTTTLENSTDYLHVRDNLPFANTTARFVRLRATLP